MCRGKRRLIRPAGYWSEKNVIMLQGQRVAAVIPEENVAILANGIKLGYKQLVWAAGGDPRKLSCEGADLPGVHVVRNRADVDAMKAELSVVKRVVVIGGGYIGLEAAAVLSKLGKQVILLETLPRVLGRVVGEELSRFLEAEHRAHGVDISTSVTVFALTGNEHISGVVVDFGETINADLVIVGIGITPAVQPLVAAGAEGENGVSVDSQCRTSLPDIYAVGDCAAYANSFANGNVVRLESVQNANDMATNAAMSICGQSVSYGEVPWF